MSHPMRLRLLSDLDAEDSVTVGELSERLWSPSEGTVRSTHGSRRLGLCTRLRPDRTAPHAAGRRSCSPRSRRPKDRTRTDSTDV
jgi:DNA-binding transcriptional ArsR family regulator